MLERRTVTRDTLEALLALQVSEAQRGLVADNAKTLAQAPYETGSYVWGLWAEGVAVGLMAMIHPREYPFLTQDDDPEAAYLWRLMIDARHQGKGHGRAALDAAARQTRDWGLNRLTASVVNRADSNLGFYESYGFRRTGRLIEGEVEILLDVIAALPG